MIELKTLSKHWLNNKAIHSLTGDSGMNLNSIGLIIMGPLVGFLLLKIPVTTAVLLSTFLGGLFFFLYQKLKAIGDWPNVTGTTYRFPFGDVPAIQESLDGRYLLNLWKKLGSPEIYRIWFGPLPALMLAHPNAVRQFWQQHDETSIDRIVKLGWPLLMTMGEGMGFKAYQNRNRINRFFHACFGVKQVKYFENSYEDQVDLFMQCFDSHVAVANGAAVDVANELRYLSLDASMDLFVGTKGKKYLGQLHELVDELATLMTATFNARYINVPGLKWFLPETYRLRSDICTFRKKWHELLHTLMSEYAQEENMEQSAKEGDSVLVQYMRMQKTNDKNEITFDELSDTMIEGFLAPLDGVAATFANTLILLAMNPDKQTKAREQIRERLAFGNEKTITLTDLDGFKYLDHVLSECQRLLPIFVFNVPELASCEMTLNDVTIPKDTLVMYDVQTLNRHEDVWPDPLSFQPERFECLNDKQRKALHGFGNGRSRRCLGEHFVHLLHKLLIARILLTYRLEPCDNERDIDKLPRVKRPFIYVPHVMLRFLPIEDV